jgi:hypothetical protein
VSPRRTVDAARSDLEAAISAVNAAHGPEESVAEADVAATATARRLALLALDLRGG